MLKVGVQTKGILPDMPVDKGFQFIKDAGFFLWGCSSVGRAPALQAGGQEFESLHLHSV